VSSKTAVVAVPISRDSWVNPEDGSVQARYTHVTPPMRHPLMDDVPDVWGGVAGGQASVVRFTGGRARSSIAARGLRCPAKIISQIFPRVPREQDQGQSPK
jgi:hypothetical protein